MHVFCVYLEFRTVVYFFPLGSYSLDNRPEILLQPQSVDIACFCSSVLNGTTVPRGRVTVCLEDLWVIRWPVMPSLNLVTAVIRHSFCDVVIKKNRTRRSYRMSNKNEFILSGKTRVLSRGWQTSEHVSVTPPRLRRYPNKRFQNVLFRVTCVASPHRIQSQRT